MKQVYIYVMDTMADWQFSYLLPLLNKDSFYKNDHEKIELKTVSANMNPIETLGGLKIVPDCTVEELTATDATILLLAGADTWNEEKNKPILTFTKKVLSSNGIVVSMCASVGALNSIGILEKRKHTSNSLDFLKLVSNEYTSEGNYLDQPIVVDGNLITASATSALLVAFTLVEKLNIIETDILDAWYNYYKTSDLQYYYRLQELFMQKQK